MPLKRKHPKRGWFMEGGGHSTYGSHPPARGTKRHFATLAEAKQTAASGNRFVTGPLASYPVLLNSILRQTLHYLYALCPQEAAYYCDTVPKAHAWEGRLGKERTGYSYHLRGKPPDDPKVVAEQIAIGGLRDAGKAVSRLHQEATFGQASGRQSALD